MTFTPTPLRDDSQPKTKDWMNILVFILLSLMMGYMFDHFIMKPKQQALEAKQQAEKLAQDMAPPAPLAAPLTRDDVVAKGGDRVTLSNDQVTVTIPLARARIDDLALKNYYTELDKKHQIELLSPVGTAHPLYTETGWVTASGKEGMPNENSVWKQVGAADPRKAAFEWNNGAGLTFTRTIALDDKFMFTVTDTVKNTSAQVVTVWPYALVAQRGLPEHLQSGIVHEGAIGYVGDSYIEHTYRDWAKLDQAKSATQSATGWMGITSRYFFVGLIPDQKEEMVYRSIYHAPESATDKNARAQYQVDMQGQDRQIAPGGEASFTTHIYAGAKQLRLLEDYEKEYGLTHFDLVMDFGWFYFLTKPFYFLLTFLNGLTGNFGVAIILLTVILRAAVFPLANTSFRSFAKMKKVAPQVQEMQKTYAHDKKRMQEELVKLYEREKVNPLSGCLPILVQIPIFFAIYKVINVAIEMRHAPFFGWIRDLSAPDPTSLFNLYGALPYDVPAYLHFGVWPTLMFLMIMIQVRLSPPQQDKMMHIFFNYYYPVMVCFVMSRFAAGLVIYWAFSSFLSVAQQIIIMRSLGVPIHLIDNLPWRRNKGTLADGAVIEGQAETVASDNMTPNAAGNVVALPDHIKVKKKKK